MSAVNRSLGCSLASFRTRSGVGDTLSRHCVRHVVAVLAFPLASPLCSADSAAIILALFVGLTARTGYSDFSGSFIIGLWRFAFPMRASSRSSGQARDIPVPEQGTSVHAGFSDHAGTTVLSRSRTPPCSLP